MDTNKGILKTALLRAIDKCIDEDAIELVFETQETSTKLMINLNLDLSRESHFKIYDHIMLGIKERKSKAHEMC